MFGVDVSSYQGQIDWNKAKAAGVEFAILKIIRKDLNPDKQFENNWKGCIDAGVEIQGVYNYSYATSVVKAQQDARRVVNVLDGRKTMVWLDVEDNCQKGLGTLLISIIKAYQEIIEGAGLMFGVYTGASFYDTYIVRYGQLNCALWIAAYGTNNGEKQEKRRPLMSKCIGWQYSSRGLVDGILGFCDVNEFTGGQSLNKPYAAKPTIKKGSRGTQAMILQKDLNAVGFNLAEDGIFGAKSDEALVKWQSMTGLVADGIYGAKSYAKMREMLE